MLIMEVADRVAVVTGGAQGIGRAICESLLQKGARGVTIVDVKEKKGHETADELNQQYGKEKVVFIHADVTSKSKMEDVFRKTKATFGGVDIYCNNAGIANEFKLEEMVDINLTSSIRNTYLAVEYMGTKNGGNGGVIIITASTLGLIAYPLLPIYSATKHGLVGFARSVAQEPMMTENNIRVAAVCPGPVNTEFLVTVKSRYEEQLKDVINNYAALEPSVIGDHVVTMIEDAKYRGSACLAAAGHSFTIIDPPKIELK